MAYDNPYVNESLRKTYGQTGQPMTAEQIAQLLYQVGFRGDALVLFTGLGKRESGYFPQTHGTEADPSKYTGDMGLFGINSVNAQSLKNAGIIQNNSDLLDPVTNAKAAFFLSQGGKNLSPWGGSKNGWVPGGDPYYGVNMTAARTAVTNAQNSGLLGQDWSSGGASMGITGTQQPTADASGGPMTLPPDAVIVQTDSGMFATFDVGGAKVSYAIKWWDGSVNTAGKQVVRISDAEYRAQGYVDVGDAEELRGMGMEFGNYRDFYNHIVDTVMAPGNPARNDPAVMAVLAEYAGRPNMTMQEFQNKLQATPWYQQHTTSQLEWNGLAEAEKQKRRDQAVSTITNIWWQYGGQNLDANDPRIANYIEDVASGKLGTGAFTELVKKQALADGESPWSREVRNEEEERRQRGVDVENTAQRVKDLARRWGVQLSMGSATDWATRITSKQASDADALQAFQDQAKVLYPMLPAGMEVATAASPWIDTYNRVMESNVDLFDPKVQAALTSGAKPWEFEQELKRSDQWRETKNGRDSLYSAASSIGHLMGFN